MNEKADKSRAERVDAAGARFTGLAAKFVERSAAEVVTMRAALAGLAAGDPHSLAEIRHLAHRMAGTGATLGVEALSDRARDVEHLAERLAPGAVPEAATLGEFESGIEALEQELRALVP